MASTPVCPEGMSAVATLIQWDILPNQTYVFFCPFQGGSWEKITQVVQNRLRSQKEVLKIWETEWFVPFERDATMLKRALVLLKRCSRHGYIKELSSSSRKSYEIAKQNLERHPCQFATDIYISSVNDIVASGDEVEAKVLDRLAAAQGMILINRDELQTISMHSESSSCEMQKARVVTLEQANIEFERALASMKVQHDHDQKQQDARELELTNLKEENSNLQEKVRRLEMKLAVMEERCEQKRFQWQALVDEHMRVRGELSELTGNLKVALMSNTGLQAFRPQAGAEGEARSEILRKLSHPSEHLCEESASEVASGSWEILQSIADPSIRLEKLEMPAPSDSSVSVISGQSSFVSVGTQDPQCFLSDAIFRTTSGGIEIFLPACELRRGSFVIAADGQTKLQVIADPETYESSVLVEIQAGGATLSVTTDHRIPILKDGQAAEMLAGDLDEGDPVYVDNVPTIITSVRVSPLREAAKVVKIAFKPDMPVAVFSCPLAISSKGYRKKAPRRSGMNRRVIQAEQMLTSKCSVPDTAPGEYRE